VKPLFLSLLLTALPVCAQSIATTVLPLPGGAGSATPQVASAYDGSLYVSWTEPAGTGHALRIAQFDRDAERWAEPVTIASGDNWFINHADTPQIAAGLRGKVAAAWFVYSDGDDDHAYHAIVSTSEDHGRTWSEPRPLSTESDRTEFVSLAPLINGDWLALWLDGRAAGGHDHADHGAGAMQLYSRVLGSDAPDTLVDDRVCDCCSIASLVLPNGAVLAAYRDRSETEVRDIAYMMYRRGAWQPADAPVADGWTIDCCPVNGPSLSRRGAHVAVAWFTAADGIPAVKTARSTNAAHSWDRYGRLSAADALPKGRVATAVVRGGSQWIAWVGADDAIALRELDADGRPSETVFDLPGATTGFPRLTVLDQIDGQPTRLLLARTEPGANGMAGRVATYAISLPANPEIIVDDCGCGPGGDPNRGHALRGRIEGILPDRKALLVQHEEVPGVMRAMTMMFNVDPRVIPLVKEDQQILARMERRDDGKWWLFNLRLLE